MSKNADNAKPATEARDLLQELLANCRSCFLGIGVLSMAINLLMLTTSLYMMQVFDRVLSSGSRDTLLYLTLVACGAVLLLAVLDAVRSRALVRTSAWLEQRLTPATFSRMVDGVLERKGERGEALQDISVLRSFLGGAGVLTLFDSPWVPLYLGVVYVFHPLLGHLALAGAMALLLLAWLNDLVSHKGINLATVHARRAGHSVESALRNAEVVDAMGLAAHIAQRWGADGRRALQLHTRAGERSSLVLAVSKFVRLFVQIAVLAFGAALVLEQELSAGAMIAASIVMGRALAPLEQAIGSWKQAVQALEAKRRLSSFFRQAPRRPQSLALPAPAGRLSVEGVVHGFTPGRPPVLQGVTFAVEAGEVLGIIGPSAAGKSTLARLLVGVERPSAGIVRLDGADVFAWPRSELGPCLGYLPQDVELFSGTVAENIARLGDPDPAAVVAATLLANCHEMILRLPDGYATELGDAAMRLSGGQRQRIALARAVYGRPKLVVLDEPNANLDAEGDALLNRAVAELKAKGTTVIIIGHRLSTFAAADKLLVLVEGAVQHWGGRSEVLDKITRRKFHSVPAGVVLQAAKPASGVSAEGVAGP